MRMQLKTIKIPMHHHMNCKRGKGRKEKDSTGQIKSKKARDLRFIRSSDAAKCFYPPTSVTSFIPSSGGNSTKVRELATKFPLGFCR